MPSPELRIYVTEKADDTLRRMDRATAFAKLIFMAFTGSTPGMTAEAAFEEELARLSGERKVSGVCAVFDGTTDARIYASL